jgi:hypothetical protein
MLFGRFILKLKIKNQNFKFSIFFFSIHNTWIVLFLKIRNTIKINTVKLRAHSTVTYICQLNCDVWVWHGKTRYFIIDRTIYWVRLFKVSMFERKVFFLLRNIRKIDGTYLIMLFGRFILKLKIKNKKN